MVVQINTHVSIEQPYGSGLGNMVLEDAKFFGRPNFSGIKDQFEDDRRKFTVLIPNDIADELRALGWNVKTNVPTEKELEEFPDRETISHMKVMVGDESTVQVRVNSDIENIEVQNFGVVDRTRIDYMDMEIRAWAYNADKVRSGKESELKYSARLVALVATLRPNRLAEKYGAL